MAERSIEITWSGPHTDVQTVGKWFNWSVDFKIGSTNISIKGIDTLSNDLNQAGVEAAKRFEQIRPRIIEELLAVAPFKKAKCHIFDASSRMCEHGTKGCIIEHKKIEEVSDDK